MLVILVMFFGGCGVFVFDYCDGWFVCGVGLGGWGVVLVVVLCWGWICLG